MSPGNVRTAAESWRKEVTVVWAGHSQTPRGCNGLFPDLDRGYMGVVSINIG